MDVGEDGGEEAGELERWIVSLRTVVICLNLDIACKDGRQEGITHCQKGRSASLRQTNQLLWC